MANPIRDNTVRRAAEEVLIAFANSDEGRATVLSSVSSAKLFPSAYAPIYESLLRLYVDGKALAPITVAQSTGLDADQLIWMDAQPLLGQPLLDAIETLKRWAREHRTRQMASDIVRTLNEKGPEEALLFNQEEILRIQGDYDNERDASGDAVLDDMDHKMEHRRDAGWATGMPFFDGLTKGLMPGDGVVIGGPYKSRKSTKARNLLLGFLANNPDCAASVFTVEADRDEYGYDLLAQVANTYLIATDRPAEATLNRRMLMSAQTYSAAQWEAIKEGKRVLRTLIGQKRVFIYDLRDGISNPGMIRTKLSCDAYLHGSRLCIIDTGNNIRWTDPEGKVLRRDDTMAVNYAAADFLIDVPDNTKTAMILLWQYRETEQDGDGSGAGLMGGTALAAAADFVTQTRYNQDNDATHLYWSMRRSRHSIAGGITETRVTVEPNGGMILAYSTRKSKADAWPTTSHPIEIVPNNLLLGEWQPDSGSQEEFPEPYLDTP